MACAGLTPPLLRALQINNSLSIWFLEDAPELQVYYEFQERFGSDEVVIVMYHNEQGVLDDETLHLVERLSDTLSQNSGVSAVFSLANVDVLEKTPTGMRSRPLIDSTRDPLDQIESYPWLAEHFLNEDHTATRLLVQLQKSADLDELRGEVIASIRAQSQAVIQQQGTLAFGGVPVVFEGLNALSKREFGLYLGISYVIMFLLLTLLYRNGWVVLLAMGVITVSTYLTLGFYGIMGYRLNIMTIMVPVILTLLGLIDVIHVVNERLHLQEGEEKDRTTLALRALAAVWKPCLFTTLTTMAGFLSLVFTPMPILRLFGLYSAIGVFLCLLFTYLLGVIFLPWVVSLKGLSFSVGDFWHKIDRRRVALGVLTAVILLVGVAGIFQIKVDTYTLYYLPEDHHVREDHRKLEQYWGDYMPLDFMIRSTVDSVSLYDPALLKESLVLNDVWSENDEIQQILGFPSLTRNSMELRYGDRADRAMESEGAIRSTHQLMERYYPQLVDFLVDSTGQYGRLTIFGRMASAQGLGVNLDTLMNQSEHVLDDNLEVIPAGYLPMYVDIVNYVTQSQIQSLLLALALIFVLVWYFIKSWRYALIVLLGNLFPLVLLFGAFGWFQIDLDVATASIAAIGLSFCIDDSIHFIYEYRRGRKNGLSSSESQRRTFTKIGAAILVSSIILFVGYSLMGFSQLKTVYLFGILTAMMVVGALYAQLVIFPILARWFDGK